jgi:hypothetical protein
VRVAIDARKLHDYGIGTYVRNLLWELARQDDDAEYVLLCPPADVEFLRTLGPRFHPVPETSGNYSLKEQFSVPGRSRVSASICFTRRTTSCRPSLPARTSSRSTTAFTFGFRSTCRTAPRCTTPGR